MAAKPLGRASRCVVPSGCLFFCPLIKFYRNPWLHPAFCPPVPSATNSNPTRRGPQHLLPCCLHRLNTLLFSPSSRPVARLLWDWDAPVVRDDFFGKAKALLKCLFFPLSGLLSLSNIFPCFMSHLLCGPMAVSGASGFPGTSGLG